MPTLQELQNMGAKSANNTPSMGGGLTLDQLNSMGAKSIGDMKANPGATTATPTTPQPGFNPIKDLTGQGGQQEANGFVSGLFQNTVGSRGIAGEVQLPFKATNAAKEYAPIVGQHSAEKLDNQAIDLNNQAADLLKKARTESDPKKQSLMREKAKALIEGAKNVVNSAGDISKITDTTGKQGIGTVANAVLTEATAGTDSLLGEAGLKAAKPLAAGTSDVLKSTKFIRGVAQTAENAALGVGFQGASNLQDGKKITDDLGKAALFSAAIPLGTKALSGVKNGIQKTLGLSSEGIINRIIKPNAKDLAYGREPARGILNEKLNASSLPDLEEKVTARANEIGLGIGQVGKEIEKKLTFPLDLTRALAPLDSAMQKAAKLNNNTLVQSLNNVKIALTHDLSLGADEGGTPQIIMGAARDLTKGGYEDAVNFMKDVVAHTKYTGAPSDDKALNAATQEVRGALRGIMNNAADKADPQLGKQIRNLNERYTNILAAADSIAHSKVAAQKKNIFSYVEKFGFPVTVATSLATGLLTNDWKKAATVLVGEIGLLGTSKVADSMAVQTRVARLIDALGPTERQGILNSSPVLQNVYQRLTGNAKPMADAPETKTLNAVKNIPDDIGTTLGISPENMAKLKTYMSLGKGAADRAGVGEDFQKLMDYVHNLPNQEGGFAKIPGAKSDALVDKVTTELQNLDTHPLTVNGKPDLSDAGTQFRAIQLQKKAAEGKITAADAKEGADLLKKYGIDVNK